MKWFSSIKRFERGDPRGSADGDASTSRGGSPSESKLNYREVAEVQVALLDAMPAHMAFLDNTGVVLEVNRAWRRYGSENGFQDENHGVGENYLHVCERAGEQGSKEAGMVADGIRKVLNGETPEFTMEYPCHTTKEKRWFRLVVSPVEFGEHTGAVIMHVDMTARKLAEFERENINENLRERVKEQRTLYRITRWLREDEGSERELLERVAAELIRGMRLCEYAAARIVYDGLEVTTDGFENEGPRIKASFSSDCGKIGEIEVMYRGQDSPGPESFLREERELLDSIGSSLGAYFTRRYDRMALQASEARFRLLFQDVANVAVQGCAMNGEILYWNGASEKLYGYIREEALGKNIADLLAPADQRNKTLDTLKQLETGNGLPASGEFRLKHKDGRFVHVFSSMVVIRHAHAEPEVFFMDVDLTERKALEQQMLRAQRLESIGTLAGGVAHHLNNMLTPVIVGAELLDQLNDNPELDPVILQVAEGSRRSAEIVKQLLSFSKGVEGRRQEVDLEKVLKNEMKFLKATFPKNIRLTLDVRDGVRTVEGDPTQLSQVLMNLCVNARDAMPDGGTLTLTLRETEIDAQYASLEKNLVPGKYVAMEVADDGYGMETRVKDRVFEPFYTTKPIGKGTGLGLSTSLGVVRSHGGFMTVYSEPGNGTVFRVYLPPYRKSGRSELSKKASSDTQSDSPSDPPSDLSAVPRTRAKPTGRGECVLVVDDEQLVLVVTRKTLEKHGYRVLTAVDGAEAIALFAESQRDIDLVITDMMMPVMNGQALISALHRIKPDLPIIATSGMNPDEIFQRSEAGRCVCFLPKPFSGEELMLAIENCQGKNR